MKRLLFTTDIYEDYGNNLEHLRECYEPEELEEFGDEGLERIAYEDVRFKFDDLCYNLDKDGDFVIFASLGLWNGRQHGYKLVDNLKDAIKNCASDHDTVRVYLNENKDLVVEGSHHDGTNYFTIRELRSNVDREKLEQKLDNPKKDVNLKNHTKKVAYIVKEVYGI